MAAFTFLVTSGIDRLKQMYSSYRSRKTKKTLVILPCLALFGMLSYMVLAGGLVQYSSAPNRTQPTTMLRDLPDFTKEDLVRRFPFDIDGDEVLVFLHMQKTGGTFFGTNLVKNLRLRRQCECSEKEGDVMMKCPCRSTDGSRLWLFSRYSVGWKCGLHADWTELHECIDGKMNELETATRNRRYIFLTILRDPVARYISEWQHVARGAHWSGATLRCDGRPPSVSELPFCYDGEKWADVPLQEFVACEHNLAHERQTRMLANLSIVNCYNRLASPSGAAREAAVLASAKANLLSLAFFGLAEYLNETQRLFEATFGMHFTVDLHLQARRSHYADDVLEVADAHQLAMVQRRTRLDEQLYLYAKKLFLARVAFVDSQQTAQVRPMR